MADDLLERLRAYGHETRQEIERRRAKEAAENAINAEWNDSWGAVIATLRAGDENPEITPDLSPLIALTKVLKSRGYETWIPDMANVISDPKVLNDMGMFRPAQVWFLNLLIVAGQPRATTKKLAAPYSFVPSYAPPRWRAAGADDVLGFVMRRIEKAERDEADRAAAEAARAAETRMAALVAAAKRRPAIEKLIFSVFWREHGLGPAQIRERWNLLRPDDSVSEGRSGRDDIKMSIRRGREFLQKHNATAVEVAHALAFDLGRN